MAPTKKQAKAKTTQQQQHRSGSKGDDPQSLAALCVQQAPPAGAHALSFLPAPRAASSSRSSSLSSSSSSSSASSTISSAFAPVQRFAELPLSERTLLALEKAKFTRMTDIQRASIPHALAGRDVLGAAKTGSGKTLAFVVPVLERLFHMRISSNTDGLACIVLAPTRELALQIFTVFRNIGHKHSFSCGFIAGGKDVASEKERISRMNILVATPGRLLQHMDETVGFDCSGLRLLVLDEADRILDMGFAAAVDAILRNLPPPRKGISGSGNVREEEEQGRQTLLFSATLGKAVRQLARVAIRPDAERVGVSVDFAPTSRNTGDDGISTSPHANVTANASSKSSSGSSASDNANSGSSSVSAMPQKLAQRVVIVPLHEKIETLFAFIKTHLQNKVMMFFNSVKLCRFVFETFRRLRPGTPLSCFHGRQSMDKRMAAWHDFARQKRGVLFCTDVAARGLDAPTVDWVVQAECPEDVDTYIHRAGRTARYARGGNALLVLCPHENVSFVRQLTARGVAVSVIRVNKKNAEAQQRTAVVPKLRSIITEETELKDLAQKAFIVTVRAMQRVLVGLNKWAADHPVGEHTGDDASGSNINRNNNGNVDRDGPACVDGAEQTTKKRKRSRAEGDDFFDKPVHSVSELQLEQFSASLGLPGTPRIRFRGQQRAGGPVSKNSTARDDSDESDSSSDDDFLVPRAQPSSIPAGRKIPSLVASRNSDSSDSSSSEMSSDVSDVIDGYADSRGMSERSVLGGDLMTASHSGRVADHSRSEVPSESSSASDSDSSTEEETALRNRTKRSRYHEPTSSNSSQRKTKWDLPASETAPADARLSRAASAAVRILGRRSR